METAIDTSEYLVAGPQYRTDDAAHWPAGAVVEDHRRSKPDVPGDVVIIACVDAVGKTVLWFAGVHCGQLFVVVCST